MEKERRMLFAHSFRFIYFVSLSLLYSTLLLCRSHSWDPSSSQCLPGGPERILILLVLSKHTHTHTNERTNERMTEHQARTCLEGETDRTFLLIRCIAHLSIASGDPEAEEENQEKQKTDKSIQRGNFCMKIEQRERQRPKSSTASSFSWNLPRKERCQQHLFLSSFVSSKDIVTHLHVFQRVQ